MLDEMGDVVVAGEPVAGPGGEGFGAAGDPQDPRFCSRKCKKRYDTVQAGLVEELQCIEEVLNSSPTPTAAELRTIRTMLAQRRWALRHYGVAYPDPHGEASQGTD